jgi:putative aldouronate transport system substrate-binding protein
MKKRHLAGLVLAFLLIYLITGCTQATTAAPTTAATTGATTTQGTTAATTAGPPVKLTGLSILWSADIEYPHPIEVELAKQANVDIAWQIQGFGDWMTKKTVMLAGGDLPDIFFGCMLSESDVNTGVFADLAPSINNCPNIKQFLSEMPEAKILCTNLDGTIYGVPNKIPLRPYAGDVFYVCKTWMDKLMLQVPTTTDEYEALLKEFVTKDPNGNKKADEIGFTGVGKGMTPGYQLAGGAGTLAMFFPAFGLVVNNNSLCMIKDGQVVFGPTMDAFKEGCAWLNKLWTENLIDHEYFNLDYTTQAAKFANKECLLVGSGNGWTVQNNVAQYVDDYQVILPLKGPHGDQYFQSDPYVYRLQANSVALPSTCADIAAAMRFVDLCYDNYNCMQIAYGSEGIGVTHDANGNPMFCPIPEGETSSSWKIKNGLDFIAPGWSSEAFDKSIVKTDNDMCLKAGWDELYAPFFLKSAWYPYVKWDTATQDELATLRTDINTYVDQTLMDFVMNGDIEAKWDNYKSTLDQMGLPHLMEIYVKGYQDSLK